MKSDTALGELERKLHHMFIPLPLNTDVNIIDIYDELYGDTRPKPSFKIQQQYVGSVVSRLNKKYDGHAIIPGTLKRTYRLIVKA